MNPERLIVASQLDLADGGKSIDDDDTYLVLGGMRTLLRVQVFGASLGDEG